MNIVDYLVPKWKHSNPEIRIKAIRSMGDNDLELIEKIARTDTDIQVRVEAVKKLSNEEILKDIDKESDNEVLISCIKERLNLLYKDKIFATDDNNLRKQLLEKIKDQVTLFYIACDIDSPEIRTLIIEKITDQDLLVKLTQSNCGLKAGEAIVEKISDPLLLERITQKASNKKIRKLAQAKADSSKKQTPSALPRPLDDDKLIIEFTKLCDDLEKVCNLKQWSTAKDIINKHLKEQNDSKIVPELRKRFDDCVKLVDKALEQIENEKLIVSELKQVCEEVEQLNIILKNRDIDLLTAKDQSSKIDEKWNSINKDSLGHSIFKEYNARFQNSKDLFQDSFDSISKEFDKKQKKIDELKTLYTSLKGLFDQISIQETQKKLKEIENQWEDIYFQSDETALLKQQFDTDKDKLLQEIDSFKNKQIEIQSKELHDLCKIVEQAVLDEKFFQEEAQVKEAQQKWEKAGALVPDLKKELKEKFENSCDLFFEKQHNHKELKDWEQWYNLKQKTELCEELEDLIKKIEDDFDAINLAQKIRNIQSQWKKLGNVSKDQSQELWHRFSNACEKGYTKCLETKQKLYEKVKELVESEDFNKVTSQIKKIQKDWKFIGPLPNYIEKNLKSNFYDACNKFFEKSRQFYQDLDNKRVDNLKIKIEFCEKAEALCENDDLNYAAEQIKGLQIQWKAVGSVPKDESEKVWNRFKLACNTVFEKLDAQKPENLNKKILLCEQLESILLDLSNMDEVSKIVMNLQKQWKEIGPVPKEHVNSIWERFNKPCDEFFVKRREYLKQKDKQYAENKALKESLVKQAQELEHSEDWNSASEKLKELQENWKNIGSALHKDEQVLWEQFRLACNTFFNRSRQHFDTLAKDREKNLQKKEDLCLQLETLAKVVFDKTVNDYDSATIPKQLSIALEYKSEIIVPGDSKSTMNNALKKVKQLNKEWKDIGYTPNDNELWTRFRRALMFFSNKENKELNDQSA